MELLSISCTSVPCHHSATLNWKVVDNSRSLKNSKLFPHRKTGIFCVATKRSWGLGSSHKDSNKVENLYQKEETRLLSLLEGLRNCAVAENTAENYNYYVTDGKVGLRDIPRKVDEVKKVLIPSLPGESEGNPGSPISSCFWEWKPKLSVHYEKSGLENVKAPNVLFLPGFGVGSFHYEKQLRDLGRDYRVWALDFLGQGLSLPTEDPAPSDKLRENSEESNAVWGFGEASKPWAQNLVYSVDLWQDQVKHFIEQVIGEPVYVVGNSLGGFVAMYFAANNPELVRGVTLLNATPFWGFLPNPTRSPRLSKLFPWAGTFPLPSSVRKLTEFVWQKISEPSSILELIKQVYVDPSTKVDKVFSRIVETTQHPAAAASFASIMFAPKGQLSFQEALSSCQMQDIPICLMYGKEDPWVRPVWGLKVKKQLPEVPYYEISPAGHCPHDEVPEVVNFLLRGWIKNLESQGSIALPLLEEPDYVQDGISGELEYVREGSRRSVQGCCTLARDRFKSLEKRGLLVPKAKRSSGYGIEGSSHIYGLFSDTLVSLEVVLADGRVVRATKDNEYSDLFYAIPWSQGALGLLVSAEIKLIPIKEYMRLTYKPVRGNLREMAQAFADSFAPRDGDPKKIPDFVESLIFTPTEGVFMTGRYASKEEAEKNGNVINSIGWWFKPWFYQHAETALKKGEFVEYLPTREYYHRHTRSLFWEMKLILPFGDQWWFRWLMGWMMPPKISLLKITQGEVIRKYYHDMHVIQDMLLPMHKVADALEFLHREMEVYPIWLCPHRLFKLPVKTMVYPEPGFELNLKQGDTSYAQMFADVGVYYAPGPVLRGEEFDGAEAVHRLEEWLIQNHGFQPQYSVSELTERNFWRMFDRSLYEQCRKKYKAVGTFMDVYYKSKKGKKTEREVLEAEGAIAETAYAVAEQD